MPLFPKNLPESNDSLFLPDFCNVWTIFINVLLTELIAFLLVLAPLSKNSYGWHYVGQLFLTDLALTSLFMQWVLLVSLGLLCLIRRWLVLLNNNIYAALLSYLLILMVTGITSELASVIEEFVLPTNSAFIAQHHWFLLQTFTLGAVIFALLLGYCYYHHIGKQGTLIVTYTVLLSAILSLSELASFFLTPALQRHQVLQHELFILRNLGISAIMSAIVLRYLYMHYQWQKNALSNAQARIQALQARIHPHFLFNSMNTIASLIRFQPDEAEQAVEDLSELFRASLQDARELVPLQEELALCEHYLRIESLRFDERLQVAWNINNVPTDALVPRLCLQPLLENAIYYGIQPLPEGGLIRVIGLFDGKHIKLEVENPLSDLSVTKSGNRIAQHNIHQRLQAHYGMRAKLSVYSETNTYHVSLYFPYKSSLK